jgi:hypothetical protein
LFRFIMPESTAFISRALLPCSIIRPSETQGAATGAVRALIADGFFRGQSRASNPLLSLQKNVPPGTVRAGRSAFGNGSPGDGAACRLSSVTLRGMEIKAGPAVTQEWPATSPSL